MAITPFGNNYYEGLTSDTKPTNVPAGAIFRDTQTDEYFEFNGTSWDVIIGRTKTESLANKTIDSINNTVKNVANYKYTIFKDGSTYYCRNNQTGAIEVSNTSPNTVLQFPLTNGGSCYVQAADYVLTGNPTVYLDFPVEPLYCEFYMDVSAWLIVPSGYAGTVVRLKNSATQHSTRHTLSVNIKEAATIAKNWTGILIEATGNTIKGVYDCQIKNCQIIRPNIGIKFNNDSTCTSGFITTNYIDNVLMWVPKTAGIDFNMDVAYTTSPANGIHRTRVQNVAIQGIDTNGVGVRNIRHKDNTFYGVYCADFPASTWTSTIHADAANTIIDGGSMTIVDKYTDSSTAQTTKIRDEYRQTQIGRVTPGINDVQIDVVPKGVSNDWSWWNSDSSERLQFRKTATDYQFNFTKQTAAGALQPALFKQVDVQGTTVESFRIETDAGLKVYTDKLRLLDSDQSHYYNFIVSNITANRNITIPALSANDTLALLGTANTFTAAPQKVSTTAELLISLYRPSNTVGHRAAIYFNLNNSSNAEIIYGTVVSEIVTATAGAEDGLIRFQVRGAGSTSTRMVLNNLGNLIIGTLQRLTLSDSGLSQVSTMTFPNAASDKLVGETTAATLTNKTLTNPTINGETRANSPKSTAYTLTESDRHIRANASTASFTLTLPTAVGIAGKLFTIKKTDSTENIVVIATTSSQTIEGLATWELRNPMDFVEVISDGVNWNVVDYSNPTHYSFWRKGTTANRWYIGGMNVVGALTTASVTANQLYAIPFIVSTAPVNVNDMAINVTTAAGTFARLGIYKDKNNYPTDLVFEAGEVATSNANTFQSTAVSGGPKKIQPGLYWFVLVADGAPTVRSVPTASMMPLLGINNTAATTSLNVIWAHAFTYAALPATFPDTTPILGTASPPAVYARFVSL